MTTEKSTIISSLFLTTRVKKIILHAYILSIILIILPPFYLFPIRSLFFTSYTAGSLLLVFLFIYINLDGNHSLKPDMTVFLISLYLLAVSLSVINAINISSFLSLLKNIYLGVMVFFISRHLLNKKGLFSLIIKAIYISTILNCFYQAVIFFRIEPLFSFLNTGLYDRFFDYVLLQADNGKYFGEIYNFSFIPILFYGMFHSNKKLIQVVSFLLISLLVYFSFVSGYRTIVLVVFFGVLSSTLVHYGRKFIRPFLLTLVISFILYSLSQITNPFSVIERFSLSEQGDVSTLITRLGLWKKSFDVGLSAPIGGVGLGNFYDYSPTKKARGLLLSSSASKWSELASTQSHNIFFSIFAETGLLGFVAFSILIVYFIMNDAHSLRGNNTLSKYVICCFWSLFIYSLFNPVVVLQYVGLFWLMRAAISRLQEGGHFRVV